MAEALGWISDLLAVDLATVGTTNVTLGFILAVTLVTGYGISVFRRVKGR